MALLTGWLLAGTLPPGQFPFAGNLVMAKEIDLRGAMRFDREFAHAVACLDRGLIDVAAGESRDGQTRT